MRGQEMHDLLPLGGQQRASAKPITRIHLGHEELAAVKRRTCDLGISAGVLARGARNGPTNRVKERSCRTRIDEATPRCWRCHTPVGVITPPSSIPIRREQSVETTHLADHPPSGGGYAPDAFRAAFPVI